MKDDEDKGSPSQDGANLALTQPCPSGRGMSEGQVRGKKKSTVQRKPFGCTSTRFIFPSENQFCNNAARVIVRIKLQRMAFNLSLRAPSLKWRVCVAISCKQRLLPRNERSSQ